MCIHCSTTNNIVHSGTDALMLGCLNDLHRICYSCANTM